MTLNTKRPESINLALYTHYLLAMPEIQENLANPATKIAIIKFLQDGTTEHLDENHRVPIEIIIAFLTEYAFTATEEEWKDNKEVQVYMNLLTNMHQGEENQQELIDAANRLPEAFKSAVQDASIEAQEYLLTVLQTTTTP
jgi:hypothetical protein